VLLLSLITCFGGGVLRDMMVGSGLPAFFSGALVMEIIVCILTALAVFLIAFLFKEKYVKEEETVDKINNILDALGLGIFASAGTIAYIAEGPFVAISMGLISSVGGSMIRDVILNQIPRVLRKRVYAVACIIGSAVYYITYEMMKDSESAQVVATIACTVVIFAIRMCATIFRWNIPKAIDFSKMKDSKKEYINK
jgi:uncharacterized membrane protein YeiH